MKLQLPEQDSRWYKFMDPANKARIVTVLYRYHPLFQKPKDWIIEIIPPIDGRWKWRLDEFTESFRPL